jgi:hypothetical protein
MNTKHIVLLVFFAIATLTACAQAPTEELALTSLRDRVHKESKGHIKVVSLTKTHGQQEQLLNGQEVYTLYYDVVIEYTKDTYKACDLLNGCYYTFRDCTEVAPSGWEAYGKQIKHFMKGQKIQLINCKMKFSLTENGWMAQKLYK